MINGVLYDGVYVNKLNQELIDAFTWARSDYKGRRKVYKLISKTRQGNYKLPYSAKELIPVIDETESFPLAEPFTLNTKLRGYQQDAVDKLFNNKSGILFSPPGSGKTVMALGLIKEHQARTLILVPTIYLLNQWKDRLRSFSNYSPGILGDGLQMVKPITIATFASAIKYQHLIENFEVLIVDEAHHAAADTYYKLISRLAIKHKYGLTATLKRKDNLEFIVTANLGTKIVVNDKTPSIDPVIYIQSIPITLAGVNYQEALTKIAYNKTILKKQAQLLGVAGKSRLGLALRLAQLDNLKTLLPEAQVITGSSEDRVLKSDLVLASTILDEGMDVDWLEVLHLLSPNNNLPKLEQRINRVTRYKENKAPVIVDYFYKGNRGRWNVKTQQKYRMIFYKKKGYKIVMSDIYSKLRGL